MLGIIGLILKIILWIILGILGLIVLLLNIVLWVPIRYSVDVQKPAEGELSVKGRVTWLLRLLRIYFEYHDDMSYRAKVLFFTVADSSDADKKSSKNDSDQTSETNHLDDSDAFDEDNKQSGPYDSTSGLNDEMEISADVVTKDVALDTKTNHNQDSRQQKQAPDYVKTMNQSIQNQTSINVSDSDVDAISTEIQAPSSDDQRLFGVDESLNEVDGKDDVQSSDDLVHEDELKEKSNSKDKETKKKKSKKKGNKKEASPIDGIKAAYEKYSPLWKDERYKGVFKFVLSNVLKILKSILPKKLKANVVFGLDDPATTAYIVGGISMFYGVVGDSIQVTPDFHEKGFEGEIFAKGRVFLGVLLYYVIRTYLDRRVRAVIKLFRV